MAVTLNLQARVASLVALDSSTGRLEKLAQKLAAAGVGNVQTRHWNLEAQPFPETGFDLVVSSMTLHHLNDVPLVFSRLAALLKFHGQTQFDGPSTRLRSISCRRTKSARLTAVASAVPAISPFLHIHELGHWARRGRRTCGPVSIRGGPF
jgi:ubiquinone/menaquinone biosynthesis C-methylase UbiE